MTAYSKLDAMKDIEAKSKEYDVGVTVKQDLGKDLNSTSGIFPNSIWIIAGAIFLILLIIGIFIIKSVKRTR